MLDNRSINELMAHMRREFAERDPLTPEERHRVEHNRPIHQRISELMRNGDMSSIEEAELLRKKLL